MPLTTTVDVKIGEPVQVALFGPYKLKVSVPVGLTPPLNSALSLIVPPTVTAADAVVPDHELVLEAADRLSVISERRLAVAAALSAAGDTEQAVVADLARMPERLRTSAAGRVAVLLARHLDAGLPAASMTSVTRELRTTLEGLARLAPDDREESVVDDLRLRRAKRLAGESEGTGS